MAGKSRSMASQVKFSSEGLTFLLEVFSGFGSVSPLQCVSS